MDQPTSRSSVPGRSEHSLARDGSPVDDRPQHRIGAVLRELAHEFGNLVFPLQMILELQERSASLDPQELKQILRGHVTEMMTLTTRFRLIGRCLSDRLEAYRTHGRCDELVQAALELCRVPRTAGHRVQFDLAAAPAAIGGDRELLQQAVAELIENSLRFTPGGTTIDVAVRQDGRDVEFAVRDDGPGIAPQLQSQVFEPFVFGSPKLDLMTGQLGCGLTLVRCIACAHDGSAELRRSSPAGTEFVLRVAANGSH